MGKILFIDYDETLHDTLSKFAIKLEGIYGLSARELMDAYLTLHRGIIHTRYPDKHDDFFFHQKLLTDHLGKPYDENMAHRMAVSFKEAQESSWTEPNFFPDTFVFLDKVEERHILCLTTGDYAREKADAVEKAAGTSYFSYIFDHTHLGIKGSSAYFENALMSTNSRPEDAIVIGDSLEHDVAAAKGAGIRAVWVNRRGMSHMGDTPVPDYEARDLFEVLKYLDGY
ncbi:MAG: HAD family hydrolase [Dehalococcoidia bacterium]|nr:MAG: HAD family hydrolase [Dehalococcoidia bacterium]